MKIKLFSAFCLFLLSNNYCMDSRDRFDVLSSLVDKIEENRRLNKENYPDFATLTQTSIPLEVYSDPVLEYLEREYMQTNSYRGFNENTGRPFAHSELLPQLEPNQNSSKKPFKCTYPNCPYAAKTNYALHEHIKIHTEARPFKCPYCTYTAKRKGDLTVHLVTHTYERRFKCTYPDCSYAAKTKSALHEHIEAHTDERPFKCLYPDCSYTAKRKGCLTMHLVTHTNERRFKCTYPDCSYAAKTKSTFHEHIKNMHTKTVLVEKIAKKPLFKCLYLDCPYETETKTELDNHLNNVRHM